MEKLGAMAVGIVVFLIFLGAIVGAFQSTDGLISAIALFGTCALAIFLYNTVGGFFTGLILLAILAGGVLISKSLCFF